MSSKSTTSKLELRVILRSRAFLISLTVILLYALCGFFLLPYLVRHYVPQAAEAHLNAQARIGEVRINPFLFTFEADDFRLSDMKGEPIAGFDRLLIDFELSSLFRWAWTFRTVALDTPHVHLIISSDGRLNLAQLIPKSAVPPSPVNASSPPRLVWHNIFIRDGEIDIIDRRQSIPATLRIRPINLDLDEISTLPDRKGPYTLAFTTLDGASVKWAGDLSLRPLRSAGRLEISDFRFASLWEFLRDSVNLTPPEGRFGLATAYTVDLSGTEPQLLLDEMIFNLVDLKLQLHNESQPLLRLDRLEMLSGALDLTSRRLDVESVRLDGGQAHVAIDVDGNINFNGVVRHSESKMQPAANDSGDMNKDAAALPWTLAVEKVNLDGFALVYDDDSRRPALRSRISDVGLNFEFKATAGSKAPNIVIKGLTAGLKEIAAGFANQTMPVIQVERLVLEGGGFDLAQRRLFLEHVGLTGGGVEVVRYADGSVNLPLLLMPPRSGALKRGSDEFQQSGAPLQFEIVAISFSGMSAKISDRTVRAEGEIVALGPFDFNIANVDGKSPSNFELKIPVRQGGMISAKGRFDPSKTVLTSTLRIRDLALPVFQPYIDPIASLELQSGLFSTSGRLQYDSRLTFDGGIRFARLLVKETGSKKPLLSWKVMDAPKLKIQTAPNRLEIDEIKLVEPFSELIINADGSVNLARVFKPSTGVDRSGFDKSPSGQGSLAFPVRANQVRVLDGKLNFADLSLTPQFAALIHDLNGAVVGISTGADDRARLELDGQVDTYGTAKIGGEINVFDPIAFTDVAMVFKNLEMASLTPYSTKFAGRRIQSGKLNLDLGYKIEDRQLFGDNQIVVDRLELGERVESPEAVNLPFDLAIALLEDSRGIIDIGLPVKGDLDEPEFSIGHLVWKALVNLLTKIVTSPFNALAGLADASTENLDVVAFEPGQVRISPPEREKLKLLSDALNERPQLTLAVQGRYAKQRDGERLKSLAVSRLLAERTGQVLEGFEDPGPVDFGNPKVQRELESMVAERFGQAQLAAQMKPTAEESGANTSGKEEQNRADPGSPYKALYRKLVESEALPEGVLEKLANDRAMAVVAEVTGEGGVSATRVTIRPSGPVAEGEPVAVKLTLEAGKELS